MVLSLDRMVSVFAFLLISIYAAIAGFFTTNYFSELLVLLLIASPGLLLIWQKEVFAETASFRGVTHELPPNFIAIFGWFYLLVIPVLIISGLS